MSDRHQENILDEIMGRDAAYRQENPGGTEDVSRETEQSPAEGLTQTPEGEAKRNKPSSAYLYLVILFGAAFLMLLLAYFVQRRNNAAVQEDLRMTTASKEELIENIKALEEELDVRVAVLEDQRDRAYRQIDELEVQLYDANSQLSIRNGEKLRQDYLIYLANYIANEEYPMAAMVVMFSANRNFSEPYSELADGAISLAEMAQEQLYWAYRQELIDRGYLEEVPDLSAPPLDSIQTTKLAFTEKWDPSVNEDSAALAILWYALEQYSVLGDSDAAAFYLTHYLNNPAVMGTDYLPRLEKAASPFTLRQFQAMKGTLIDAGVLRETPEGGLAYVDGYFNSLELYGLPFALPLETAD